MFLNISINELCNNVRINSRYRLVAECLPDKKIPVRTGPGGGAEQQTGKQSSIPAVNHVPYIFTGWYMITQIMMQGNQRLILHKLKTLFPDYPDFQRKQSLERTCNRSHIVQHVLYFRLDTSFKCATEGCRKFDDSFCIQTAQQSPAGYILDLPIKSTPVLDQVQFTGKVGPSP